MIAHKSALDLTKLVFDRLKPSAFIARQQGFQVALSETLAHSCYDKVIDRFAEPANVPAFATSIRPVAHIKRPSANAAAVNTRTDVFAPIWLFTMAPSLREFSSFEPCRLVDDRFPMSMHRRAVLVAQNVIGDDTGALLPLCTRARRFAHVGNEPCVFWVYKHVLQTRSRPLLRRFQTR